MNRCELELCNEIQLLWLNEIAIELINGLNVNQSNVNELIWNNECKCLFIKLMKFEIK